MCCSFFLPHHNNTFEALAQHFGTTLCYFQTSIVKMYDTTMTDIDDDVSMMDWQTTPPATELNTYTFSYHNPGKSHRGYSIA